MTLTELAVIVFGLFAGYWVVGKLFFGSSSARPPPAPELPKPADAPDGGSASRPSSWPEILKVTPDASLEELRAARERLLAQYRGEQVATFGDDLRALAERRISEIENAYREALRARGAS